MSRKTTTAEKAMAKDPTTGEVRKKSTGSKLLYRPVGLIGGILAGTISGAVFKQVWRLAANEDDAPGALQSEYRMREVVLAAALQGAIFAATKAAIDRAGARGFSKLTGSWPGY